MFYDIIFKILAHGLDYVVRGVIMKFRHSAFRDIQGEIQNA